MSVPQYFKVGLKNHHDNMVNYYWRYGMTGNINVSNAISERAVFDLGSSCIGLLLANAYKHKACQEEKIINYMLLLV